MDAFIEICTIVVVLGWLIYRAGRAGWNTYWSLTGRRRRSR